MMKVVKQISHCEHGENDARMVPCTEEEIESIIKRLKRIEGQVRENQKAWVQGANSKRRTRRCWPERRAV